MSAAKPDVVVNCAAWTAVDAAEDHEDRALAVNAGGASHLAGACAGRGRPADPAVHGLRIRRHRPAAVRRGRPARPGLGLWADQTGGRAGRAQPAAGRRLRAANGVAVRGTREQLPSER